MKRIALVLSLWVPVGCGGSSSETPFPQVPVDPELQARHDAVLAESTADDSSETNATSAAAAKPASAERSMDSAAAAEPGKATEPAKTDRPK
jgi:hypothetical protein